MKARGLDALLVYVQASAYPWSNYRRKQYGLYSLAQAAVDAGFRVKVDNLSTNDHVVPRLCRLLHAHNCAFLGLYVDHDNVWFLRDCVGSIKAIVPDCEIVLGGPQVTADPERAMAMIPGALCAVIGEGEDTFVDLLERLTHSPASIVDCPGLLVRTESSLIVTAERPLIDPLDRLSIPNRRELEIEPDETAHEGILTSRGCPGVCSFCFQGGMSRGDGQKRIRFHSMERCLREVELITRQYNINYFTILDDNFVSNPERVRIFCREIKDRYQGKLGWFCEARANNLYDAQDLLPLMVESGLVRMQIGGESGCPEVLAAYRKGVTVEQVRWVAETAYRSGLRSLYINFILGGALETRDSYNQTSHFMVDLLRMAPGCVDVGFSYFTPYPGTLMYTYPERYGIQIIDSEGVTGFDDSHVFCRTDELSRFEILALGCDLTKTISQVRRELCRSLSFQAISEIFSAYHRWGLATEWYSMLSQDPVVAGYHGLLAKGHAKRLASVVEHIDRETPVRTVELRSSVNDSFLVQTPKRITLMLDPVDRMIVELSCGKLTFLDILGEVSRQMPNIDLDTLRSQLVDRFHFLDEHLIILWKERDAGLPADSEVSARGRMT